MSTVWIFASTGVLAAGLCRRFTAIQAAQVELVFFTEFPVYLLNFWGGARIRSCYFVLWKRTTQEDKEENKLCFIC